jgi:DNA excision repair protein ERCC-6-like 2
LIEALIDLASLVLTSFDLARREIDLLDDLPWSCIFVDEVHRVKNAKSKITEAYHQFSCKRRFGLTGTTIQNSYMEMWTILDWTNPGRLGTSKQWTGYVVRPLTVGQSAAATEDQRATALVSHSRSSKFCQMLTTIEAVAVILRDKLLPQFFLRRYLRFSCSSFGAL